MTKNELIQWLEKYVTASGREMKVVSERELIEEKIADAKHTINVERKSFHNSFFLIIPLFALFGFTLGYMAKLELLWITVCVVVGLLYGCFMAFGRRYDSRKSAERRANAEKLLPKLEKKYEQVDAEIIDTLMDLSILEQQDVLSEKYMNHQAASRFLEYLRTGRADTLKEAMNLYENERFQERMYRENQRHHRQMEDEQLRQTEELKRARQEAERAAETAEQAAKQAQKDANFDLFANAVILDAALKEDRRKRGYDN